MKKFRIIIAAVLMCIPFLGLHAQNDPLTVPADTLKAIKAKNVYTEAYLDTVKIDRKFVINDYSLVGVSYGVEMNSFLFNPPKESNFYLQPVRFGVTWTQYGKLFGFMPYVGFQTGFFYSHEGFQFKPNKATGNTPDVDGATTATISMAEVPFLAEFHIDGAHFRVLADAGIYGGYRYAIERSGPYLAPQFQNAFRDYEINFTYGLEGGVGFALIFDPFEFHLKGQVRYGWSSLYHPDYYSEYYYRYAYPLDVCITAGLHFQISKRTGKTKKDLKREAYEAVYGTTKK